jgi:hypothetical protein
MADRLLSVIGHQALQLGLCLFMLKVGRPGPRKDRSKFRPGVGRTHIDDTHCLDARLGRVDPEQRRRLAALDTAPEFPFGCHDQMLIKGIGMRLDLYPFSAARDHREDRTPSRDNPHVMLQLSAVFLDSPLLRE